MSEPTPTFPVQASPHPREVWVIQRPRPRWWLYVLFFALTLFSTTLVGAHMQFNFVHRQPAFAVDDDLSLFFSLIAQRPSSLLLGLPFSLTLMFILLAHEMGHYLYARHYHVYATPPFFIPFPSLFGTLGAFIRIKGPIPSRDVLFDIGIAGPIAGFIPACGAVAVGLLLSHPLAHGGATTGTQLGFLPLIFHVAARILHIHMPLASLSLHPIAAAGWVGMFATAMNLLPGGQLDGGHIIYSVVPRLHRSISLVTVFALILLAKYFWVGWLLWSVVLLLTSYHPPLPGRRVISGSRKAAAVLALVMLTLAFTPEPFTGASGREVWPQFRDGARDTVRELRDKIRQPHHR
jgi:membrane-associated protease RseP (regulator of RpoE activity)